MTLAIELKPDVEAWLRDEAKKRGEDPSLFIVETLEERRRRESNVTPVLPPRLGREESHLLTQINEGLAEEIWNRYSELVRLRRREKLTVEQHQELLELSGRIEEDHVCRIEHLVALAKLRNTTLDALMYKLGIKPRPI